MATRLQQDLAGVTVTMNPPRRPENNEGYFEYIEGPITQANASSYAVNSDSGSVPDTTVGDFDDILMFTTRSTGQPFVGRANGTTVASDVAEVAWFVRGRTLHRRALLVVPSILQQLDTNHDGVLSATELGLPSALGTGAYYANYDVSARIQGAGIVPNTLGDLTRRECRFAHAGGFPYSVANNWWWTWVSAAGTTTFPTLPTLDECSFSSGWALNQTGTSAIKSFTQTTSPPVSLDFWTNVPNCRVAENAITGSDGTRVADDVILTNVIGFDVKAWDPTAAVLFDSSTNRIVLPGDATYILPPTGTLSISGYGAYVDLGYLNTTYAAAYASDIATSPQGTTHTGLGHFGHPKSYLNATASTMAKVYDTYSTHYENVTLSPQPTGTTPGQASNGFDDDGDGIVDEIVYNGSPTAGENITAPPYPVPLRGIQVKIRVFEPDSRQILEWTVVQDFLPQ